MSSYSRISHGDRDAAVARALVSRVLFRVVRSHLAPRVFLRFFGFPPSAKTNTPNSNSISKRTSMKPAKADVAPSRNIVIYLFILIYFDIGVQADTCRH